MLNPPLLSDMPLLFFQFIQNGFLAAIKERTGLPQVTKKYNLDDRHRFIILPRGFTPELKIPYLAAAIQLDEHLPQITLRGEKFHRCYALLAMRADEEDLMKHLAEPGQIFRSFRVIEGGKK